MGGCFSADRKSQTSQYNRRSSTYHQSRQQSSLDQSQVFSYVYDKQEIPNFNKKTSASKKSEQKMSKKQSEVMEYPIPQSVQSQSQHQYEQDKLKKIKQILQRNKKESKYMQKQKQMQNQKEKMQATKMFVQKTVVKESHESPMASLISDRTQQQNEEVMDIISNYGSKLFQSKFQRQFLTSSQFKQKLAKVQFIQKDPTQQFSFLSQEGKGSICKVYKACSLRNKSKQYAVRIISIDTSSLLERIKQQIAVMNLCQSQNIIKHYFTYNYQNTLFMFIQYMNNGSLNHFISHFKKNIDQGVIAYIIRQILRGLKVIHGRRQVHRDLKSDNILTNINGDIKIADFGYALQLTKEKMSSKQLAGTPAWMAPQLIKKQQYSQKVDVWSLGIILVELCQGQPKYLRMKPLIAMIMIATKPPETVVGRSQKLQNFLQRCLKKQPWQRARVNQLLSDPFITGIRDGQAEKQRYISMLSEMNHSYI